MTGFSVTHAHDNPNHEAHEKKLEAKRKEDQAAIDKVNAESETKRDSPADAA